MKKLSVLFVAIFLTGCIHSPRDVSEGEESVNAMKNMPCHKMGDMWMGDCEFDEEGNPIGMHDNMMMAGDMMHIHNDNMFSQEIDDLPEAKSSEIIELSDGDILHMTADMVKQTVGNRVLKRLAYNGQIPGPMLRVPQNAQITVEFTNNIDVDTTIHSHGLRLDNAFDGVPDVTQDPIKPGESFTYQLKFPDAGVYWYHPHIREDYTQELGLYGNFLVAAEGQDYWSLVDREQTFILDDIAVAEDGVVPFSKDHTNQALMGRFGNIMLINNEENFLMTANTGDIVRLFITNVANTRTFNFTIPKARMKLVGGDSGRIEREEFVESIILAPSERVVVEIFFEEPGMFDIQHRTPQKTYDLGTVLVEGPLAVNASSSFEDLRQNVSDYALVRDRFDELLKKEPDKNLRLSIDMKGMMNMDHGSMGHGVTEDDHQELPGIEWEDDMAMMNQMSTSENTTWKLIDEETGNENMDINWEFQRDEMVKIRVFNDPESVHPMQHPIHFHGQRFVILARNGKPNENLQWKDTALVQTGETIDFLVEMSNPGEWMAHCHIAEHLHAGMMFGFTVYE